VTKDYAELLVVPRLEYLRLHRKWALKEQVGDRIDPDGIARALVVCAAHARGCAGVVGMFYGVRGVVMMCAMRCVACCTLTRARRRRS
jgi:hypothetical protein